MLIFPRALDQHSNEVTFQLLFLHLTGLKIYLQ